MAWCFPNKLSGASLSDLMSLMTTIGGKYRGSATATKRNERHCLALEVLGLYLTELRYAEYACDLLLWEHSASPLS